MSENIITMQVKTNAPYSASEVKELRAQFLEFLSEGDEDIQADTFEMAVESVQDYNTRKAGEITEILQNGHATLAFRLTADSNADSKSALVDVELSAPMSEIAEG